MKFSRISLILSLIIISSNVSRAQKNSNHYIGGSMGYGFTNEKILKYNVEFNLNYIYNRKHFVLKAKTGLCPFTYFGNYNNEAL